MARPKIPRQPCEYCGRPTRKPSRRYCSHTCSTFARALSPSDRFELHVDKTGAGGCWLWTGALRNVYGGLHGLRRNAVVYAHHVAWEMAHGPIPAGLWVLHNCPGGDNPRCVNPAHLFLGTHADNMRDMSEKGRGSRNGLPGELNPSAKLTEDEVRAIRLARAAGRTLKAIGERFHVSLHAVWDITHGRSWTHLT